MKDPNSQSLCIIGGGITGLVSAYLAARAGKQVTVLEAGSKPGGLLNTFEIASSRLEFYYHHFFTHDAELHWLVRELGLEEQLYYQPSTMGVFRSGNTYNFNGPLDLLKFRPISFPDKIRFGLSSLYLGKYSDWKRNEDRPALDWFYRHAGKTSTESLWEPMLRVKFGPYAEKVPLSWMIGRLRQRLNSRKGTEEQLGYLRGSLQTLLDALLQALEKMGCKLVLNAPVEQLQVENGQLKGLTAGGQSYQADQYLSTIPTIYLKELVRPHHNPYAQQLEQIEYFGAVCVILQMKKALSNIYWLNVADPGFPFGGVIEHTNFVPPENYQGKHLLYLSRYFAWSEAIAGQSEEEIKNLMLPYLPKIYPHFREEDVEAVHVFKTRTAATVCDLNFSQKVPDCQSPIGGLYLSTMAHVYPDERSTNNSIRIAAEACRVMGMDTSHVPHNASMSGQIGFAES